jgi:hypothetical protein
MPAHAMIDPDALNAFEAQGGGRTYHDFAAITTQAIEQRPFGAPSSFGFLASTPN